MDQSRFNLVELQRCLRVDGQLSSDYDLTPGLAPTASALRPAAVLIPLIEKQGNLRVILTKRSEQLKHHPGQISFPGGKVDPGDATPTAAALREAEEEIGLPRDTVDIIGLLDTHQTVTRFTVTPVIGVLPSDFSPVPEAGEVEEAFEVPLAHLLDPANMQVHERVWRGQLRRYYAVPYGPYYVWGATARIIKGLSDRVLALQ